MPIFPGLVANSGGNLPGPPTNIGLTTVSSSSLLATWTAPEYLGKHPLGNYVVSLYNSSGTLINESYAFVLYPATSLTISGLSASTTYSVKISLQNSIGLTSNLSVSSPNASTSAVTPTPPPPVTPPTPPPTPTCVPNFGADCFGPNGEVGQIGCSGNCVYTPITPPTPPPVKPPTPPPVKPPTKPPTPPPVRQCVPPCSPPAFCLNGRCAA
jgi:hypothetical protein